MSINKKVLVKKPPDGFTCECGHTHEFSAYVYAHWKVKLYHMCKHCNRKHSIKSGKIKPIGVVK